MARHGHPAVSSVVKRLQLVGDGYPGALRHVLENPGSGHVAAMAFGLRNALKLLSALRYSLDTKALADHREYRTRKLEEYFPEGKKLPASALPDAALHRLSIVLFPRIFPVIRRIVTDFVSSRRRQTWHAW